MWIIEYETSQMVSRHAGTLPVLLTCAHGAPITAKPPGVSQRAGPIPGCPPNKLLGDSFTRQITTAVAQLLLETLGEPPYVVIAEYHRKFIDANRSETCAFNSSEAAAALPFYAEYHQAIRSCIDEIQAENGSRGFLFDIHGTTTIQEDPADVYIGTDNGASVQRLLEADPLAVFGRRSLRGLLRAADYVVSPARQDIPETPQVDGGFTTQTYGSSHVNGLDAMQLEIAQPIRQSAPRRQAFIEHLGRAIGSLAVRLL
jgi:predicted N-formylglutamate amidohydrolase